MTKVAAFARRRVGTVMSLKASAPRLRQPPCVGWHLRWLLSDFYPRAGDRPGLR